MRRLSVSALITLFLVCAGCQSLAPLRDRDRYAREIATGAGLQATVIGTDSFHIQAWHRLQADRGVPLHVYIEGDGHAWRRRYQRSSDPTPREPLGLELAAADRTANVIYLARPCQYTLARDAAQCGPRYWTGARYSEAVIASLDQALSVLKHAQGRDDARIVLIGYSGGGTVAALLAARRDDVRALITIAANLDHQAWTRGHGDTPLSASLNAADIAGKIRALPQIHFAGGQDKTVPLAVIRSYLRRMGDTGETSLRIIPGFDHHCCWLRAWPRLLCQTPADACD